MCAPTHLSSPVCVIQLIDLDRSLWNAPTISLNIFEMHRQYLVMSGFPSDERVFHACPSTPPVIASQPKRSWFFLRKKSKTCQETSLYASHRFDQQFSQQCWVLSAAGRLTPPFQLKALLSIVAPPYFDPLDQSCTMSRLDKMAKWQNGSRATCSGTFCPNAHQSLVSKPSVTWVSLRMADYNPLFIEFFWSDQKWLLQSLYICQFIYVIKILQRAPSVLIFTSFG